MIERLHGGHFVATDVEHHATAGEVGIVGDEQFGDEVFFGEAVG